jgi:hypothetical protein
MLNLISKIHCPEEPFMRLWIKIPVLTFLLPLLASAEKSVDTKLLSGLKAVEILIESLNPDTERDGLSSEQLRTDVELRLRRAGINLLDDLPLPGDMKTAPDVQNKEAWDKWVSTELAKSSDRLQYALLYLNLSLLKDRDALGLTVFNVMLQVRQEAALRRNREMYVPHAVTWERAQLGFFGARFNAQQYLRQVVADLVDQFINDYLSVNPPGASR